MKKNVHGITLIALVITIIVLLILAGVSIAMLTGQNGILTQAQNAKTTTEQASAREKVEIAVAGAMAQSNNGTLSIEDLKTELSNYGITTDRTKFPLEVEINGQKLAINNSGTVTNYKEMSKITGAETSNTTTKDKIGNYIVVPAGFKIINPNENVTDGIVVEDVSHAATAGSQFVWIPVGDVIKDSAGNKETIKLGRYSFDSSGNDTAYSGSYFTEDTATNHNSEYKNTIAKDIEDFKNKVNNITHGYYIGRYEARDKSATSARTSSSVETNQLVCTANNYVYNYITQPKAAELSRGMYSDSNFESDLMNSYAWDTAVYFLQKFDNRANKDSLKPYSQQNSLNTGSLANQGTNNLSDASKQDVICNVYDMASNCREWTTETSSRSYGPCTSSGGNYGSSNYYTSYRDYYSVRYSSDYVSFRSLLYM